MDIKEKKKDRQPSRGIFGSPKKGGAGGKGTWGKGGADDLVQVNNGDPNDPNYCSDEEEQVVLEKVELQSPFEPIITEYLTSGDVQEVIKSLKELGLQDVHQQFVKKAIVMSMEKGSYERELVSKLLSTGYNTTLVPAKIAEGFQCVVDGIDDIILDSPDAADLLSKFIARAVVDEIIPPAFIKNATAEGKLAKETLALANALITEKYRSERLAHIWGPGDLGSVKRLKEEAKTLFAEYLTSGDTHEADSTVRKMSVPSFHFQLVKEALRFAMQKTEEERKHIFELLGYFFKTGLISPDHMKIGFKICYEMIDDLKLDVPTAPALLNDFTKIAKNEKWLSKDFEASP